MEEGGVPAGRGGVIVIGGWEGALADFGRDLMPSMTTTSLHVLGVLGNEMDIVECEVH